MNQLPRVSLLAVSPGSAEEGRAAAEIDLACREVGFFVLSGHGIPCAIFDEAYGCSHSFFRQPLEAKNRCRLPSGFTLAPDDYTPYGYSGLLEENAFAYTGRLGLPSDYVEKFSVGRLVGTDDAVLPFPEGADGQRLRAALKAYYLAIERLTTRLGELFSIALDLPRDFFALRTRASNDSLRSLFYPSRSIEFANDQGMGEHTDGTLMTVLAQTGPGIQVKTRDGRWITPAVASRDDLLVNVGDLMARWSNDQYVSTPHRVVLSSAERQSLAFFQLANDDAVIECFPRFCRDQPAKYAPIVYKKFSLEKMHALFGHNDPSSTSGANRADETRR